MRLAIAASLQDMEGTVNPTTPPRSPLLSPIVDDDDDENFLQGAILASIEAAEQSRLANFHANQVMMSPPSSPPPPVSYTHLTLPTIYSV